jgi:beta-glucosidase
MPKTKPKNPASVLKFPSGFLWGAATSAYQVEGGITNNDWEMQSRLRRPGRACDHYLRYKGDFLLAKKLHHNAHRLSLEWSRIEPQEDTWDDSALEHYFHVLKFLKEQGFVTFLTLHHFTNPVWVARQSGWTNKKTISDFLDYLTKVVQSLGQFVDYWVTVNEPNAYVLMSYLTGIWPPFEKSIWKACLVYKNLFQAHNRAYEIIHANYPEARVGFAQNISWIEPFRRNYILDRLAVKAQKWLNEDLVLERTKYDFIGLNHYFFKRTKFSLRRFAEDAPPTGQLTDKGWMICPRAIYEVLMDLKKYRKPIFVTENGIADAADKMRAQYIQGYLREVHKAITHGVPVGGYFYWSLLDNFEWPVAAQETGYESCFGLAEVDFLTQRRRIRPSAGVYSKICKTNFLEVQKP